MTKLPPQKAGPTRRELLSSLCIVAAGSAAALGLSALWPPAAVAHEGRAHHGQRGHHADSNESSHDPVTVEELFFPVQLSDGNTYEIAGYLYYVGTARRPIVQVAVHGGTHFHGYWDVPPINGVSYSYARYMARRGYTVLAIDQLGTGASSQPDGDFVTLDETASALHQVLASLREPGNPTGQDYDQIALVGHSNGSLTSVYATGTYHDADALVTTAWMHVPHPLPFDPGEILSVLTEPYIPATAFSKEFRTSIFYHVPTTDPDFIDYEHDNLGTAVQARAQFIDLFSAGLDSSLSRSTQVTVPVLVQNGDFDALQPSAFMEDEPDYYPNAESVTLNYLEEIGHNVNGHRNHLQSWVQIDHWLRQTLPQGSCRQGPRPGRHR